MDLRIEDHPILSFPERKKVKFFWEGREVWGYEGEPVASALHAAGIKVLHKSLKLDHPRGFFCAIGNCSSCLVVIDGVPNVRACTAKLRAGMRVEMQRGAGPAPSDRE
ncbi:MAG TPA: (2Fe-2S)-binding protein [Firmicutes bacterium]|uniref:(2Fe-2S)-binding protein n=1 Tax=Candidatus Fermentithermobacillus carboniphilus TaxID=3085328 RepID=A0AAT9LCG5_9FIRM|nr:MAG: (2Fe-2S)-binding protein [Candidatus Fermentithermobacillus carboniphilus]HHW17553.1 (2Fe-2S)-binding protein [Candidatus Fermentithermobacillaceae bacterium]